MDNVAHVIPCTFISFASYQCISVTSSHVLVNQMSLLCSIVAGLPGAVLAYALLPKPVAKIR